MYARIGRNYAVEVKNGGEIISLSLIYYPMPPYANYVKSTLFVEGKMKYARFKVSRDNWFGTGVDFVYRSRIRRDELLDAIKRVKDAIEEDEDILPFLLSLFDRVDRAEGEEV
jgi:hypothetical protein